MSTRIANSETKEKNGSSLLDEKEAKKTIDAVARETGIVIGTSDPILALDAMLRRHYELSKDAHESLLKNFRSELMEAEERLLKSSKELMENAIVATLSNAKKIVDESQAEAIAHKEDQTKKKKQSGTSSTVVLLAGVAVIAFALTLLFLSRYGGF